MAIKFLSGQTISGTLTVSGNVQGATFNGLAINTTGVNNVANQIVRTEANGYVNFGWINSVSGNHTGSITRITASNDAYLRYVTPAQFRTGVTDGFYAPSSTVSGVTSVATGNGLTGGTITSTGTLSLDRPNSQLGAVLATYGTTAGASGRVRCTAPFNTNSSKMFSIEVTLYTNYTQHNYVVSAYMYSTTNQWYSPKAIYTTTGTASPDIYVGRDGNGKAYISIANSAYTGVLVHNMTRGYTTSLANTYEPWTITIDGGNENSTSVAVSTIYTSANLPSGSGVTSVAVTAGAGISASVANSTTTPNITITNTAPNIVQTSVTGNAGTSTTFSTGRTNYKGVTDGAVAGQMMWKNYGNNHTIFDASSSTSPNGGSVNNTNSAAAWTATYPTLMGWNGTSTYGVRVDSARIADSAANQGNYLPLAGGVMSGNIGRSAYNSGFQVGGYNNIGASHAKTNPIHTIGSNYLPTETALSNMYGIGFTRGDVSFMNLSGISGWGMYVAAAGTVTVALDAGNGVVSSTASVRSPIFYDSNNTAFYVDPASTSKFNDIWSTDGGNNTTAPRWDTSFYVAQSQHYYGHSSTQAMYLGESNTINIRSIGVASGSLRAPVFYDSNDTTYYGDFAGQSSMYGVAIRGDLSNTATGNQIFFWGSGNSTTSAIGFKANGGNFVNPTGNGDGYNTYLTMDTDGRGWVFRRGTGGTNFTSAYTAGWILNNGIFQANASMRAPIFYDSNNTAYYLDPASTSNLSKAIFNTSGTGLPRQITIKEDGDTENSMGSYPGAWTSALNIQSNDASTYLWLSPLTSNIPRIQTNYGQLDFYTGSNTGRALHLSGTSARSEIFYDLQNTAYYGDFAGTSNLNGLTVAGTITGTIQAANKLPITGYQTNGQSFYQSSGSFAGFSGWHNYYIGNHGNGSNYYNTTIAFPFWGQPRYSRLEGGTSRGPYNFLTNEADQTIGVYLQSTTSLRAPIFYDYNNTAFYIDPSTTGTSVNVAGDVVAYASSDIRFKNNITPITNALDKINKIGGYTFEWNEISHKETGKKDIGVVAQEVEEILPEIVDTRDNGYKAVDYSKLTALLIQSVKEQQAIINDLKTRIETLENN